MALTNAFRDYVASIVTGDVVNKYDTTNGYLSVGDSATAFANTQTDLQAASNKLRSLCTSISDNGAGVITAVTTYTGGQANYAWQEFGLFNNSTGGTMMQRVVSAQGTKTAGQSWQLTETVTISVP
jgi:hypothetical protein